MRAFRLEEIVEAQRTVREGHVRGKVVVPLR